MTINKIEKGGYLGPLISEDDREKSSYASNKAPAYIPNRLLLLDSYKKNVDQMVNSQLVTQEASLELLKSLKSDIKNHVEYRIQAFFQQLLIVYGTKLTFHDPGDAEAQIGGKGIASKRQYAGAHSSTLTSLHVEKTKSKIVSLIKGTFFHNTWNSTVFLPKIVNDIDSDLDWRTKDKNGITFRNHCVKLLNKVSKRTDDPKEGLKAFLKRAVKVLSRLNKEDSKKKWIIKTYRNVFKDYASQLAAKDDIIQSLTFVNSSKLNRKYYLKVQASMHQQLKLEVPLVQLKEKISKEIEALKIKKKVPEIAQWTLFRMGRVSGKYTESIRQALCNKKGQFTHIRETAAKYKIASLNIKKIRSVITNYLKKIKKEKLASDLTLLRKNKWTQENLKKLSKPMKKIYELFIKILDKKPRNLHMILLHLLYDLSYKQNITLQKIYPMNTLQFYKFEAINPTATNKIAQCFCSPKFQKIQKKVQALFVNK